MSALWMQKVLSSTEVGEHAILLSAVDEEMAKV